MGKWKNNKGISNKIKRWIKKEENKGLIKIVK